MVKVVEAKRQEKKILYYEQVQNKRVWQTGGFSGVG